MKNVYICEACEKRDCDYGMKDICMIITGLRLYEIKQRCIFDNDYDDCEWRVCE